MPADAAASLPSVSDLQQRIEMLEAELRARVSEQAALTSNWPIKRAPIRNARFIRWPLMRF
jgi:hypothetical protein